MRGKVCGSVTRSLLSFAGSSCPLDKSIGIVRNYGANNGNAKSIMIMNYDMLEMLEYPFFTMTKYPPGIIRYIGIRIGLWQLTGESKLNFDLQFCQAPQ